MKKIIFIISVCLLITNISTAQTPSLDSFFKKYSEQKGFTYVFVGKLVLNLAIPKNFSEEFQNIKFIKVLTYENFEKERAKNFKTELKESLEAGNFTLEIVIKDDNEIVECYLKETNNKDNANMIVFVEDDKDINVIWINGTLKTDRAGNKTASGVVVNKSTQKKEISLPSFTSIEAMSALNIFLIQSDTEKVVIEANDNIIEYVDISVKDRKLTAKIKDNYRNQNYEMKIYIYFNNLKEIRASSACDINSKGQLKLDNLKLTLSGASDANMTLNCNNLQINTSGASDVNINLNCTSIDILASGASDVKLSGTVTEMSLNCSGASKFSGKNFTATNCKALVSGASEVEVRATNKLELSVSGVSSAKYYGSPKEPYFSVYPDSYIKKIND